MLITLLLLLALIAGITALSLCWAAARLPRPWRDVDACPALPPVREVPGSRYTWLEVDDTEPYDDVTFDRQITAMLQTTARWQAYQERGRVA